MKSIRFNDLSKASQIFAESFVEKEPKIKSRKSLNESLENYEDKRQLNVVIDDYDDPRRYGKYYIYYDDNQYKIVSFSSDRKGKIHRALEADGLKSRKEAEELIDSGILDESIKNKPLKENYSIVDLETGERFGNFNSVESAMNKAQRYSQQCSATCAVVYSGVFGDSNLKVICGYKNGKERRVTNEALSDEAKANNEMIQRILNKKPSQLTAKEKKFLADNDLVRYDGTGGYYHPNIRKNGASWSSGIGKGDSFIINRNLTATNIDDVDQLNLLKKRDERSRARYEADRDPDILEPQNIPGLQGKSKLQVFNKNYEKDIKGSKRYAKNARDFMDSYIETGGRLKADLARHNADASRVLKDQAKKSLEHRPKFESINEPHGEYFKKGSRS